MNLRQTLTLLTCAAAWAVASPAPADAGEGQLNAVRYRPAELPAPIRVRTLNDSDADLAVRDAIVGQLQGAGYQVSNDAQMVLTVETRSTLGSWSGGGGNHILELEGHGGRKGGEDAKVLLNLFNSDRGGVLNKAPETTGGNATEYRIDLTLDDWGSNHRLWQGWATADLDAADEQTLLISLVDPLVKSLGQTVRRQTIKTP